MTLLLPLLPTEDFRPVWDRVAATIRTGYYARAARHDEMESLLAKAAPLARAAPDRRAFEDEVNRMIAGFGDSHFEFLSDEDQGYYLMDGLAKGGMAAAMPQVGAWFRRSPDGYTVQMLLEGGAAERAGLRVGDLVTRVDGRPFSPVKTLEGAVGRRAVLTLRRGGAEREAALDVTRSTALRMFLDATLASRRTIERGGKRLGYLHLWTQAGDEFRRALADALAAPSDGFVLDLRGGFGGHVEGYVDALRAYRKPLAVVIDHGSRSAKEVLSALLQRAGRATLVGERTAGAVLGTEPMRLTDWAYLEVPRVEVPVGGERLEGRGVSPDVEVSENGDPVERAVEILASRRV